ASLARLVGYKLHPDEAPDSYDISDALLGKSKKGRNVMLEEAFTLALRSGDWKYIDPQRIATPVWEKAKKIETGLKSYPQLYNLKNDIGEQVNIADSNQKQVKEMKQLLQNIEQNATRAGYKKLN
ncbi:MAG: arylsulfatase, partial [Chitinophagaceae bacterium]|nr:arylsulfatase [Chitinophagaceae bacterium]